MKKRGNGLIMIAIIVILVIAGVIAAMTFGKHYVNIKGQHLKNYSTSTGGGMTGGYKRESVKKYDDGAVIRTEYAKWYGQDPEIHEYLVDASIMDKLEDVVRKNGMNRWNQKEFSKIFIADGESTGYYFRFDEESFGFSSQSYPLSVDKKLSQLDAVVEEYLKNASELPGLVLEPKNDEDYALPENEVDYYVYYYTCEELGVRILNGTDEMIEAPKGFTIVNENTGEIILEEKSNYSVTVYPESWDELTFTVKKRLDAGLYQVILGDVVIPFELR